MAQNIEERPGKGNSPIVVHHLPDTRSHRILWLLEELQIPYEVRRYERRPGRMAHQELLGVHPLGKFPVIIDGGLTIAESGVIVEYIIKKYGGTRNQPTLKESGWLDNLYYTHFAEGTLQPLLFRRLVFRTLVAQAPPTVSTAVSTVLGQADEKTIAPDLKEIADMVEIHLGKNKWFAGGDVPTSADYMMLFSLEVLINRAPEYVGPAIRKYVKGVQARLSKEEEDTLTFSISADWARNIQEDVKLEGGPSQDEHYH